MALGPLLTRILLRLRRAWSIQWGQDPITGLRIARRSDLVELGTRGGRWTVPADLVSAESIVYCVGCGEDISFDLALIERFGCSVHAFDPTPRAIAHVAKVASGERRYHFLPLGLWSRPDRLRFFAPRDPRHVSHSALNLQGTQDYFEADVDRLSAIMSRAGHTGLDLLKLDIEGAEYAVLDSLHEDGLRPGVLCVEFDEHFHPQDDDYRNRIKRAVERLLAAGYVLCHTSGNANYTFVRTPS
jgi:FkbM family methyltransferase